MVAYSTVHVRDVYTAVRYATVQVPYGNATDSMQKLTPQPVNQAQDRAGGGGGAADRTNARKRGKHSSFPPPPAPSLFLESGVPVSFRPPPPPPARGGARRRVATSAPWTSVVAHPPRFLCVACFSPSAITSDSKRVARAVPKLPVPYPSCRVRVPPDALSAAEILAAGAILLDPTVRYVRIHVHLCRTNGTVRYSTRRVLYLRSRCTLCLAVNV